MSGTGFPSGSGLDDPAAWAVPTDTQMLDWLTKNYNCEVSHSWETEEARPWEVHKATGSRNDREWRLVARGSTPREAIAAAMKEHP